MPINILQLAANVASRLGKQMTLLPPRAKFSADSTKLCSPLGPLAFPVEYSTHTSCAQGLW